MSYQAFVTQKVEVALKIASGGWGGGYTEAAIILAALSSGMAADIWPGCGIDRKRFVELWAKYADTHLNALQISVPLLTQGLRADGDEVTAEALERARPEMFGPGHSSRVLIGSEVDMTETEIGQLAPKLKPAFIRSFSYAALFYKHVRCGLVHEFHVSECATWNPMTKREAHVSYSNRGSLAPYASVRLIHFQITWVAEIIRSIIFPFADSGPVKEQPPGRWWIEG